MASSTAKHCLARLSAYLLLSQEILDQEKHSKEETSEMISVITPNTSVKEEPKLIALTSCAKSDSHLVLGGQDTCT